MWTNVQQTLFPYLENELGELTGTHKKLVSILELIRIEEFISCTRFNNGRPRKRRACFARAYIAKIVFKFDYTKQLVEYLNKDKQLRAICGWDASEIIPSEATFSRAFKEFCQCSLPEQAHKFLIQNIYEGQVIGHVVKDSAPIEVREKSLKKGSAKERKREKDRERSRKKRRGEPNLRQKQMVERDLNKLLEDLPKACDKGMKKSSQGYTQIWKGYKLHSAVDDHCIPLAVIVTSASVNDCEVAIPLARKAADVATSLYDLMDAAYDHPEIKEHSKSLGHVPIIDKCPCNKKQKAEIEAEKERKKALKFSTAEDRRYKERFPKERFNAMYKDFHGGRSIYYKGYEKVSCHILFGVLTLTATSILNLIQ